jgi:hypothetical protein
MSAKKLTARNESIALLKQAMEEIGEFYDDDFADAIYTVESLESIIGKTLKCLGGSNEN